MEHLIDILREHDFPATLITGVFLFGVIIALWVLQGKAAVKFPVYRRVGVNIASFWGVLAAFVVMRDGEASSQTISLWVVAGAMVISLSIVLGHTFENITVNKGDVQVHLGGNTASGKKPEVKSDVIAVPEKEVDSWNA